MSWEPSGFVPPPAARLPPAAPAPPDRLKNLPTLALFMMLHGGAVLLWVAFCVFAILVGVINVSFISRGTDEDVLVIVIYSLFAAGAFPVGVAEIVAGARIKKLKSRKLALGALFASVFSFFCGNVFCVPFSVALLAFGIITLLDKRVTEAFNRVEAGEPPETFALE